MASISVYLNEEQQKFILDLDKEFEMRSEQRKHHRALIGKIIRAHHTASGGKEPGPIFKLAEEE